MQPHALLGSDHPPQHDTNTTTQQQPTAVNCADFVVFLIPSIGSFIIFIHSPLRKTCRRLQEWQTWRAKRWHRTPVWQPADGISSCSCHVKAKFVSASSSPRTRNRISDVFFAIFLRTFCRGRPKCATLSRKERTSSFIVDTRRFTL